MKLVIFRQPKHGQGCSTTAALLAIMTASKGRNTAIVCTDDTGDDMHAILGMGGSFDDKPIITVDPSLTLLLSSVFPVSHSLANYEYVIVDAGVGPVPEWAAEWTVQASVWVTLPCYLALRRAQVHTPCHRHILRQQQGRALSDRDVANVLTSGPAECVIPDDPRISRAIDAGMDEIGSWRLADLVQFPSTIWFDANPT